MATTLIDGRMVGQTGSPGAKARPEGEKLWRQNQTDYLTRHWAVGPANLSKPYFSAQESPRGPKRAPLGQALPTQGRPRSKMEGSGCKKYGLADLILEVLVIIPVSCRRQRHLHITMSMPPTSIGNISKINKNKRKIKKL